VFDLIFGPPIFRRSPTSGLCAFGFEANPRHGKRLKEISTAYQKQRWFAQFFVPVAVSDNNAASVMFHSNGENEHHNWAGSVTFSGRLDDANTSVKVPTIDLAEWITEEIVPRTWLAPGAPHVLMKMDIEGSEYTVLPKLLAKGLLCRGVIDTLFIEFHKKSQGTEVVPDVRETFRRLETELYNTSRCGPRGITKLSKLDDESFHHDGKPLP